MKIPIVYAFIYKKLKERNRGNIVRTSFLKGVVCYIIDNRHGIPKSYCYDIIKDMEDLGLIKRINHKNYQILRSDCEKRLKKFW